MAIIAGKGGAFLHNSVSYPAKSWSIDISDTIIETTSMLDSGWRTFISGLRGATFTAETFFDPVLAQLTPGQTLTNLQLSLGSSTEITVASALVRNLKPSTSVEGASMLTIEGTASGTVNTTFA